MLDYAEYKEVLDILNRTDHKNTYTDLRGKEEKILDTVNSVARSYRDFTIRNKEFISRGIQENITLFWLDMGLLVREIIDLTDIAQLKKILLKGDRVIYYGCIFIFMGVIFFFLEISK
jgi:hypothetical protein